MSRPNRCIKDENGEELWISRSAVVIPIVFKLDPVTGNIYTLVEKRGEVVSHTNEWCCPSGFLDWDETLVDACIREVREETGLELDEKNIKFFTADSNILSKNQTVDLWYMCWTNDKEFDLSKIETQDEVYDIEWLKVGKLYEGGFLKSKTHIKIYKKTIERGYGPWAFLQHPKMIIEMLKTTIDKNRVIVLDE